MSLPPTVSQGKRKVAEWGYSRTGRIVPMHSDFTCPRAHPGCVMPGLHPKQHVHTHVKGLPNAQGHLSR